MNALKVQAQEISSLARDNDFRLYLQSQIESQRKPKLLVAADSGLKDAIIDSVICKAQRM